MKANPEDRRTPSFRQLCRLATEEIIRAPAIDDIEWKDRITARVVQIGYRCPQTAVVYRAIDAVAFVRRRKTHPRLETPEVLPPPAPPPFPDRAPRTGTAAFVPVGSLCPQRSANACGHSRPVSGRSPLVCDLARDHDGDHGMSSHGVVIIRWSR